MARPDKLQDNPLIQADMQLRQQQPMEPQERIPSQDELMQLGKTGKLSHMGGTLPGFLKGIIPEAKDRLKEAQKSKGGIIGDITVSGETLDVLADIKKLSDVTDKGTVDSDLDNLGFNADIVPEWFREASIEEGVPEDQVDGSWNTAREAILSGAEQPVL